METILQQREAVVREAMSWLRTPYHPRARIKGVGVDCGQFPAAVYHAAGVIPAIPVGRYSPQWHMHQTEQRYLAEVLSYAREISCPLPGDFVLYHVGKGWAHGAIITGWPTIIHAVTGQGVTLGDASRDPFDGMLLRDRQPRFFSPWTPEA